MLFCLRNCPAQCLFVCYHFNLFNTLISDDFVLRYTIINIAKPTATSAAATAMIKNTKTCPLLSDKKLENATNNKLTAFSINSIDMKIIIALRLNNTPNTPMVNNTVLSNKYHSIGITCIALLIFFYLILFLPNITAPTIAANNNTDDTSKGSRKSLNNVLPRFSIKPMFGLNASTD